jgi:hypothetical protein
LAYTQRLDCLSPGSPGQFPAANGKARNGYFSESKGRCQQHEQHRKLMKACRNKASVLPVQGEHPSRLSTSNAETDRKNEFPLSHRDHGVSGMLKRSEPGAVETDGSIFEDARPRPAAIALEKSRYCCRRIPRMLGRGSP